MLCDRYEITIGRSFWASYLLSCLRVDMSSDADDVRFSVPVHTRCKVSTTCVLAALASLSDHLNATLLFQLSQLDVPVHCHITYSAKLLCHLCAAGGGYDHESCIIFRLDAGSRDCCFLQPGADNREGEETGAHDKAEICIDQCCILFMLAAELDQWNLIMDIVVPIAD